MIHNNPFNSFIIRKQALAVTDKLQARLIHSPERRQVHHNRGYRKFEFILKCDMLGNVQLDTRVNNIF